jgi:membrane-associated phospholipid phosphatase
MDYLSLFIKLFQSLDTECFLFLNKILLNNTFAQHFWGILSHKHESWINVIIMLFLNVIAVLMIPKARRSKAIAIILYCWLSFQVVLLVNTVIFQKILQINRDSPSVVVDGAIKLSSVLNNSNLKDYSNNSFPAGHALVLIYWALFINLYAPRKITMLAVLVSILLIMPRMITGAHWLSDTIFSLFLGWMYFNLSMWFANRYDSIKYRLY